MFAFVLLELRPLSLSLSRLVAAISQIAPNIIREDRERERERVAEKRRSKEKLWVQTNGRNVFPPSLFLAEVLFSWAKWSTLK